MPIRDSDTFTYSNGDLAAVSSSKWMLDTVVGSDDATVLSGQLRMDTAACVVRLTTWAGSATDQYVQATHVVDGNEGGPVVRANGLGDAYLLDVDSTQAFLKVFKIVGGATTALDSVAVTPLEGDMFYLEARGTALLSKQNGEAKNNFTDSAIATGAPGMGLYGNNITFDDWIAGDFTEDPSAEMLSFAVPQPVG